MSRTLTVSVILVLSLPEGMTDQEGFTQVNKDVNPYGVEFIYPANVQRDVPVILARVIKTNVDKNTPTP